MTQRHYRQCADCGASLDPGESCGCGNLSVSQCLLLIRRTDDAGQFAIECRVGLETWRREYKDEAAREKTYSTCCMCSKPCAVYGEPCKVIRPARIKAAQEAGGTTINMQIAAGL